MKVIQWIRPRVAAVIHLDLNFAVVCYIPHPESRLTQSHFLFLPDLALPPCVHVQLSCRSRNKYA